MTRSGPKTPLRSALRYLGFRPRTEWEVGQKLMASGFSQEQANSTLEELKSRNLVNDESFARDWTQLKTAERGYGPLFVKRELHRRGVAHAVIQRIISETFGDGHEFEQAKQIVGRRFGGDDLSDPKTLKRAQAFLLRRGYHSSVIADVLGEDFEGTPRFPCL